MSIDSVCWAWNKTNITPLQKLILIYLADSVDMNGHCDVDTGSLLLFLNIAGDKYGRVDTALHTLDRKKIIKVHKLGFRIVLDLVGYKSW